MKNFKDKYSNCIEKGIKRNASYRQKRLAIEIIAELKELYTPHFLRRIKKEIF